MERIEARVPACAGKMCVPEWFGQEERAMADGPLRSGRIKSVAEERGREEGGATWRARFCRKRSVRS